jgi:hypothetical protein
MNGERERKQAETRRYNKALLAKVKAERARPHAERHPNDKNIPNPDRCVRYEQ